MTLRGSSRSYKESGPCCKKQSRWARRWSLWWWWSRVYGRTHLMRSSWLTLRGTISHRWSRWCLYRVTRGDVVTLGYPSWCFSLGNFRYWLKQVRRPKIRSWRRSCSMLVSMGSLITNGLSKIKLNKSSKRRRKPTERPRDPRSLCRYRSNRDSARRNSRECTSMWSRTEWGLRMYWQLVGSLRALWNTRNWPMLTTIMEEERIGKPSKEDPTV